MKPARSECQSDEVRALQGAVAALEALDHRGRVRAIRWLSDRLGVKVTISPAETVRPVPTVGGHEARKGWLQEAWAADVPVGEIAEALGLTVSAVNTMVFRMRQDGWDLPKRKRAAHGVSTHG